MDSGTTVGSRAARPRRRHRVRTFCGLLLLGALVLVAGRVLYAFTEMGQFNRLLGDLQGRPRSIVDRALASCRLINAPYRLQPSVTLDEMKSIRPLSIEEWATLSCHDDSDIRRQAIEELDRAGDPRVVRATIADGVRAWPSRWYDHDTLLKLAKRMGYDPFLALLADPDRDVRAGSAEFLLRTGRTQGLGILVDELDRITTEDIADATIEDEEEYLRRIRTPDYVTRRSTNERRYNRVMDALTSSAEPAAAEAIAARWRRIAEAAEAREAERLRKLMGRRTEEAASGPDGTEPDTQRKD